MFISDETIAKVRDANDIAEVISEFVPHLKRAGKDFKALCPFHHEKTPSFMISPSKGIFHCFGCGIGGDVFKFVMEMDKCSYPEAIKKLAERKGIPVQEGHADPKHALQKDRRKALLQILHRAAQFYHKNLLESAEAKEAREYLTQKRGLTPKTIERFLLGWAPSSGHALLNVASKSGISEKDLADAGAAVKSQKYGKWYDWFRGRIIFPIFDLKGDIVGFGGRVLESAEKSSDNPPPKYINSPDTDLFQKGKNLYGFFQGIKTIRDKKNIIVLEGYMDVIGCHQAGIENAAAPLGTALTADQCLIIKRYAEQISLLFDADAAGDSAALRGSELLLEYDLMPMIAHLPNKMDADEYLQKYSAEDFFKLLRKSMNAIEFKLHTVESKNKDASDIVKKGLASEAVLPLLLKIENEVVRREMIKLAAKQISVSEEALIIELNKAKNKLVSAKQRQNRAQEQESEIKNGNNEVKLPAKKSSFLSAEEELLCLVLRHRDLFEPLKNAFQSEICFSDIRLMECYNFLKENRALEYREILHRLPKLTSEWMNELLSKQIEDPTKTPQEIFQSSLEQLLTRKNREQLKNFGKKAAEGLNQGQTNEDIMKFKELMPVVKGLKKR